MIKAVLRDPEGHPLVLLGLTARNIEMLQKGDGMVIDLEELGLDPGKVLITYGEDEATIATELRASGFPVPEWGNPEPGQRRSWARGDDGDKA